MSARTGVPPTEPLRVHGDEPVRPRTSVGDEMGDEEVQSPVDQHFAEVDGKGDFEPAVAAAQRASQVTAGEPEGRERQTVLTGRFDDEAGRGIVFDADTI